jgi:hypothetical protein
MAVPQCTVLGLCDGSLAGCRVVLSQVLAAGAEQPAGRWSAGWTSPLASAPPAFALARDCALAQLEGASSATASFVALNGEIRGEACLQCALELTDRLLAGAAGAAEIFILAALRFMPDGRGDAVHVEQLAGPPRELPAALCALPRLGGGAKVHDRFLATLVQVLTAKGASVTLLAVSSIAARDADAAASALGACAAALLARPCALDARLVSQIVPGRYTDALVETNGFFLYT